MPPFHGLNLDHSEAGRPPVVSGSVEPRLPEKGANIDGLMSGWRLLCGWSRCNRLVGKLQLVSLTRQQAELPASPPFPGEHPGLRAAVEAQAPEVARCAVLYVLPEGFARRPDSELSIMTQRASVRERAARVGWLGPWRATHRPRLRLEGRVELYATAPPLPCFVRCPECGKWNRVTGDHLTSLRETLARLMLADGGGYIGAVGRDVVAALASGPATADAPPAMPGRVEASAFAGLIAATPALGLIAEATMFGRPVTADDFFVVVPDRAYPVAASDPEHMAAINARRRQRSPAKPKRGGPR